MQLDAVVSSKSSHTYHFQTLLTFISGYCGHSEDYCGTGCDPAYGDCNEPPPSKGKVDDTGNGRCGSNNGGFDCPTSECCSQ